MRFTLFCFSLLFVACASDVNRLDGDGCQPSCRVLETEGEGEDDRFIAECLTPDLDVQGCVQEPTPSCASGVLACGDDGFPTCEGAPEGLTRPVCSR